MNKDGGDDLGPMASPSAEPDGSGWLLRRDSYGFHRTFFRIVGRPALLGEYTRLCRQVRTQGSRTDHLPTPGASPRTPARSSRC